MSSLRCHFLRFSFGAWAGLILLGAQGITGTPLAAAAEIGPVVSTQWVADHLDDPTVRLVEIDDAAAPVYASGHLPGAIGLVLQNDLMDPQRRDWVSPSVLEKRAGRLGLSTEQTIVFYDAGGVGVSGLSSIYGYWVFKYRGAGNLTVLNGGLAKWKAESRAVTTEVPHYFGAEYDVAGTDVSLRTFRDAILRSLPGHTLQLLDVRTHKEFIGQANAPPGKDQNITMESGHIPGAKNILWSVALNASGTFKTKPALRQIYQAYLKPGGAPIVTYCLRGERGVVTWFILHEMLGQKRVSLYDGSWTEWGNLVNVPIAR